MPTVQDLVPYARQAIALAVLDGWLDRCRRAHELTLKACRKPIPVELGTNNVSGRIVPPGYDLQNEMIVEAFDKAARALEKEGLAGRAGDNLKTLYCLVRRKSLRTWQKIAKVPGSLPKPLCPETQLENIQEKPAKSPTVQRRVLAACLLKNSKAKIKKSVPHVGKVVDLPQMIEIGGNIRIRMRDGTVLDLAVLNGMPISVPLETLKRIQRFEPNPTHAMLVENRAAFCTLIARHDQGIYVWTQGNGGKRHAQAMTQICSKTPKKTPMLAWYDLDPAGLLAMQKMLDRCNFLKPFLFDAHSLDEIPKSKFRPAKAVRNQVPDVQSWSRKNGDWNPALLDALRYVKAGKVLEQEALLDGFAQNRLNAIVSAKREREKQKKPSSIKFKSKLFAHLTARLAPFTRLDLC